MRLARRRLHQASLRDWWACADPEHEHSVIEFFFKKFVAK